VTKAGILWRTGIHPGDIGRARHFYSGGVLPLRYAQEVGLLSLQGRLTESGMSAFQFCFYVCNYVDEPFSTNKLQHVNSMATDGTWDGFMAWYNDLPRFLMVQVTLNRDQAKTAAQIHPLISVLLDTVYEFSPVMRIELALQRALFGEFDPSEVIRQFAERAGTVLMGIPQYLDYCPLTEQLLENPDVSRQFFPQPC